MTSSCPSWWCPLAQELLWISWYVGVWHVLSDYGTYLEKYCLSTGRSTFCIMAPWWVILHLGGLLPVCRWKHHQSVFMQLDSLQRSGPQVIEQSLVDGLCAQFAYHRNFTSCQPKPQHVYVGPLGSSWRVLVPGGLRSSVGPLYTSLVPMLQCMCRILAFITALFWLFVFTIIDGYWEIIRYFWR